MNASNTGANVLAAAQASSWEHAEGCWLTHSGEGDRAECATVAHRRNWSLFLNVTASVAQRAFTPSAFRTNRHHGVSCAIVTQSRSRNGSVGYVYDAAKVRIGRKAARKAHVAIYGFLVSRGAFVAHVASEAFLGLLVATWPVQCSSTLRDDYSYCRGRAFHSLESCRDMDCTWR